MRGPSLPYPILYGGGTLFLSEIRKLYGGALSTGQRFGKNKRMKKPTLREIAQYAGVHYSTASCVLNGARSSTQVSQETRQRILKTAAMMGYQVNRAAQQLRTQKSHVIGLSVGDVENPFFARIVTVCAEELEKRGYEMLLAVCRKQGEDDLHSVQTLSARQVDGFLLWNESPVIAEQVLPPSRHQEAIVLGFPIPGIKSIAADMRVGIDAAVSHLAGQGRKTICYLAPRSSLSHITDPRPTFCREAVEREGLLFDVLSFEDEGSLAIGARHTIEALLHQGDLPDALLCFNDMVALGALTELRRAGIAIPERISVIGCDDLPLLNQLGVPLTTIAYPITEMCQQATKLLLDILEGIEDPATAEVIGVYTSLVIRETG